MTYISEIAFVDPSVDDVETIVHGLRPEVRAIVLDGLMPPARQMALALEGCRQDLDAVHIIAHGAPGRVNFPAGEWSDRRPLTRTPMIWPPSAGPSLQTANCGFGAAIRRW